MTNRTKPGYRGLLADGGFQCFLWTQFLAAFNDNVYKMIVSVFAVSIAADQALGGRYLALAGAIFVVPFLLFSGFSGQLADRFSKTRVLQATKAFEIVIMLMGLAALVSHSIEMLLGVLFLLAVQATFFSPAKYGILPEMVFEAQLTRANGLLELTTFVAIILGTSFGTLLFEHWRNEPVKMGLTLLAIAIVGSLTSIRIPLVPAAKALRAFQVNPFAEIWAGTKRLFEKRSLGLSVLGMSYFWFVGALFQMALLLVGRETLHVSELHVGLLVTALAAGIGVGSVVAGRLSGDHIELGLVPLGAALMGVFTIAMGRTTSYNMALIWLAALGFAGGLFVVPLNAWLQDRAGAQEKGRLMATNNFFNSIGIIVASGFLWLFHDKLHWTASHVILALGCCTMGATLLTVALMPAVTLRFVLWIATNAMINLRIIGRENLPREGAALLASNHVSYVDVALIGCATGRFIRYLMWQPLYDKPFLKPFCKVLRAIPIPTNSPKETLRALRNARTELERGKLVGIFPEGSLTQSGHVAAFQRGYERVREGTGAPIVPIYVDGMWGHPLSKRPGKWGRPRVTVVIGKPIQESLSPVELRARVMELAPVAVGHRKTAAATLVHRFTSQARSNWRSLAMADATGKSLTYGETLATAVMVRNWLRANARNEPAIGLLLPSSIAGAIANLGVTFAGRTAVNLNFTSGEQAVQSAIEQSGVRTVITSRTFMEKCPVRPVVRVVFIEDMQTGRVRAWIAARFAPLANRVKPDDVAAVIFSSGSTAEPKGVRLTHWNLLANMDAVAEVYQVDHRDGMLGALPFFHSFGYTYNLWFPLTRGMRSAFHSNPMDAKTIGELALQQRSTFLISTPTFCATYLRRCTREQFAHLRYTLVGAEKLRSTLAQAFLEKFGVTPFEGYGCTEMGPVVAVNAPGQANRAGSVGRPLPGICARIVDPDTFAPSPEGLLLVNGPSRMAGYTGDPHKTEAALREGYYITGDIARIDEDGFLYIVDRMARFSKIAGEMVPHLKIEEALGDMLGDAPCVVVGIPDEQRGERLVVLYTSADADPARLIEHLNGRGFPALWTPKRESFHLVDAIPTLGSGKLDLRKARALAVVQ